MHRHRFEEERSLYSTRAFSRRVILDVLYAVQDGKCGICGKRMDPLKTAKVQSNPSRPTRDHVLSQGMGGPDEPGNLLAAHARCNNDKSDAWPSDAELTELERVNREMGWRTPAKLRREG